MAGFRHNILSSYTGKPSPQLSFWFSREKKNWRKRLQAAGVTKWYSWSLGGEHLWDCQGMPKYNLVPSLVPEERGSYEYTWFRSQHCGLLLIGVLCIVSTSFVSLLLGWHVRFQPIRHSVRRYLASFHWILWSSGHWLGSWWVHDHEYAGLMITITQFFLTLFFFTLGYQETTSQVAIAFMLCFAIFAFTATRTVVKKLICIFLVSGTETLADMIEKMIGKRPNIFFLICWKYISPIATLVRFFYFLYNFCNRRSGIIYNHLFLLLDNHPGELSAVVRYFLRQQAIPWLGRILWVGACNCIDDNGSNICNCPVLPLHRNLVEWCKCLIRLCQ